MTDIDEAAGLVALYTLCIECFIYKDLSIKKDLVRIAKGSMALAGAVILILAMANALTYYVVDKHIPERLIEAMLKLGLDKTWQFLIVMNIFLLVLGMIMDGFSAILVAVPLVLPFAAHFGLGPFHVAIMFVLNLELAFSCPPLGLNLFISSFRFNRPVVSLYKLAMPFVGLLARGAARHHVRAAHLEHARRSTTSRTGAQRPRKTTERRARRGGSSACSSTTRTRCRAPRRTRSSTRTGACRSPPK